MTTKPGDPVWVDLFTSDPEGAVAFYGGLFGWTADRAEEFGGYLTFRKDGKAVAGGMGKTEADADAPDQWTIYLSAADARATAAAAAAHGGTVVVAPIGGGGIGPKVGVGEARGGGGGGLEAGPVPGNE
ncbi:VOC family protein, partial [Nocardia farcinica]|uniref:VOC family protein n=1 Tax=Nocardia farcinica TaxID=37329 RepID=UPI002457EB7B